MNANKEIINKKVPNLEFEGNIILSIFILSLEFNK